MVSDYYRVAPENGPRIVVIGGGHGQSTLLRGLKLYSKNLSMMIKFYNNKFTIFIQRTKVNKYSL